MPKLRCEAWCYVKHEHQERQLAYIFRKTINLQITPKLNLGIYDGDIFIPCSKLSYDNNKDEYVTIMEVTGHPDGREICGETVIAHKKNEWSVEKII